MGDDSFPSDVSEASETGDLATLTRLLDAHPEWINWRDLGGATPLHYAANIAVLRLLVDRGGDIRSRNDSGKTLLHIAARSGDPDRVSFLLNMRANANASDRYGRTPLHEAARNGNVHVVRLLIEGGADPNRVDDRGDSPLTGIGGVTEERKQIAETLLNAGARLNLNSAMENGNHDYVLERITGPNAHDEIYAAPFPNDLLTQAVCAGSLEIVSLLLKHGISVNSIGSKGCTALCVACQTNAPGSIVKLLLDNGADIDARIYSEDDNSFETPLDRARKNCNSELANILIEKKKG